MALLVGILGIFLAVTAGVALYVHAGLSSPTVEDKVVHIRRGETVTGIARQLQAEGLTPVAPFWTRLAIALTADQGPIQAGEYAVAAGSSGYEILATLRSGRILLRSVTFPEGWTLAQWRSRLASLPYLRHTTRQMTDAELAEQLGARTGIEGWLFPDTYRYARGSSDLAIFKKAYRAMQKRLESAWDARNPSVVLESPREALIFASIVEKETGYGPDRTRVASVFHNRLRSGMKLQSDPTVIFGLGAVFDGDLTRRHLDEDQPYNSYTRFGLPPGPICSPGMLAINAALNPEESDHLYFVARGDGKSVFSRTLEEHNDAVNRYQRRGGN